MALTGVRAKFHADIPAEMDITLRKSVRIVTKISRHAAIPPQCCREAARADMECFSPRAAPPSVQAFDRAPSSGPSRKRLFGDCKMLKKIALAAVAATLIAGPALAADSMAAPASKTAAVSSETGSKMTPTKKKHKAHKKTKKEAAPATAQ
jgi:hypothetical protein